MTHDSNGLRERVLSSRSVFVLIGLLTFVLYLPAIKAGWVIDAAGWLAHVKDKNEHLLPYLNRSWSTIPGLYQFTQLVTLLFYKIWGANVYAWSLLYQAMHALNAWLFFIVAGQILADSGYNEERAWNTALTSAVLFTICPHISEVLIWKACYHYLQGFLMLFFSVYCFLAYQHSGKKKFAWLSAIVFGCSVFSLEVFYLTPFFLFALAFYYARLRTGPRSGMRHSLSLFLAPQFVMILCYMWLFRYIYPGAKPHVYNLLTQSFSGYVSKGPEYFFHLFFFGRYFPFPLRQKVYAFCETGPGLALFYGLVLTWIVILWRGIKKGNPFFKTALLWTVLASFCLALLFPLAFPRDPLLVFYDRYTYVAAPVLFLLATLCVSEIRGKYAVKGALLLTFACVNLYVTVKLNLLWKHSNFVVQRLLKELPDPGKRTVLLLNVPDNMSGVGMIGANPDGAYTSLRSTLLGIKTEAPVYDVFSYNLTGLHDACRVRVKNDSMLYVSFNQIGNWWTYDGLGAHSYTNSEYSALIRPRRNDYMLILKHPWSHYLILNEVDGNWIPVKYDTGIKDYHDGRNLDTHWYDEWKLRDGEISQPKAPRH